MQVLSLASANRVQCKFVCDATKPPMAIRLLWMRQAGSNHRLKMVAGLTNLTYYTCLENVTGDILQFRPCHTRWVWGESQGAPHPQLWNPYLASYYCIVLQVLNPIGVWLSKNLRAKPASCLIFLTKRLPGRTWPILPTQVNLTCWRCRYYSKKYVMKNAVNHLLLVYSSDGEI